VSIELFCHEDCNHWSKPALVCIIIAQLEKTRVRSSADNFIWNEIELPQAALTIK